MIFREQASLAICEQIELRLLHPDEIDAHYALLDANRDHIGQYEHWALTTSHDDEQALLSACWQNYLNKTGFAAGIFYREAVGSPYLHAGFLCAETVAPQTISLLYWLGAAFIGKGIATRSVKATVKRLLGVGARQVQLRIVPDNISSIQVAQRCNFQQIAAQTHDDTVTRLIFAFP